MKNYKSKIGLELILPISLLFGYALFLSILEKNWFKALIVLLILSILIYTFLSIYYKIEQENLIVKCAFYHETHKNFSIQVYCLNSYTYKNLQLNVGKNDN